MSWLYQPLLLSQITQTSNGSIVSGSAVILCESNVNTNNGRLNFSPVENILQGESIIINTSSPILRSSLFLLSDSIINPLPKLILTSPLLFTSNIEIINTSKLTIGAIQQLYAESVVSNNAKLYITSNSQFLLESIIINNNILILILPPAESAIFIPSVVRGYSEVF